MEIDIIETNENCCCSCKGRGKECEEGGAWIYCSLRGANDEKFDADCGENLGCNHFQKRIDKLKNVNKREHLKQFSDKECICGGHNDMNVKKNKKHNSTKKRLNIRILRRYKKKHE
jgi:hypothetical protein